jgi:UDP-2-acetamido-2,6-beta-L-arabino-hexul-4-ose reductase
MIVRVLVTGAEGFIGKNLRLRLRELPIFDVIPLTRSDTDDSLQEKILQADAIVHLAGVNRPKDAAEFNEGNVRFTSRLCEGIKNTGRHVPLILASSTQANLSSPYGASKRAAEDVVAQHFHNTGSPVVVYRLPNVFGKWCRPNYNSVVATFCHNIANELPIQINDASANLTLIYIDDLVDEFLRTLSMSMSGFQRGEVTPSFEIQLGQLAALIEAFRDSRISLVTERVGTGLARALYATYVSYLRPARFAYDLPKYSDSRGDFVEILKTRDSGQFSYFTARPGVTRGGHYHHSKTEKFLVVKGRALFAFRHLITGESCELETSGGAPQIVETVPGWTHNITNIGEEDMFVMLWANEIFDRARPDTVACKV